MRNIKIYHYTKYKYSLILLIFLTFISVSLGYLEGIITFLLNNASGGMAVINLKDILIQSLKEISVFFLIIFIILFTKGPFLRKTANFLYIISIKCISYYTLLFFLNGLKFNLLSPDLIFIIPVPFIAPVIVPIIISVLLIIAAFTIHIIYELIGIFKSNWKMVIIILSAILIWFISFACKFYKNIDYSVINWILFFAGLLFFLSGYFYTVFINFHSNKMK